MKAPQIIIGVVAALVLAGGGFAAGMTVERNNTAEATRSGAPSGAAGRPGQGGTGAFVGRGGASGAAGAAGQQILARRLPSEHHRAIARQLRQPLHERGPPTPTRQGVLVYWSPRAVHTR